MFRHNLNYLPPSSISNKSLILPAPKKVALSVDVIGAFNKIITFLVMAKNKELAQALKLVQSSMETVLTETQINTLKINLETTKENILVIVKSSDKEKMSAAFDSILKDLGNRKPLESVSSVLEEKNAVKDLPINMCAYTLRP